MKFFLILCLSLPVSAVAQFSISKADIDSLRLPITLYQLTSRLEEQFAMIDRPLLIERKWKTLMAYYAFQTSRTEISLFKESTKNLKVIHRFKIKKQENAEISDEAVLLSHNKLLSQKISLLQKQHECRTYLLTLLQLCNIEITSNEQETSQTSD